MKRRRREKDFQTELTNVWTPRTDAEVRRECECECGEVRVGKWVRNWGHSSISYECMDSEDIHRRLQLVVFLMLLLLLLVGRMLACWRGVGPFWTPLAVRSRIDQRFDFWIVWLEKVVW